MWALAFRKRLNKITKHGGGMGYGGEKTERMV